MKHYISVALGAVCVIFLLNILLLVNATKPPAVLSGKAIDGVPYYFQKEQKYWSEISDVLACGDYLYVLYGNKNVLACYSLDGVYMHSFLIVMGDKGKPSLLAKEDVLYVETKRHDYYSFQNGQFVEWFEHGTAKQEKLQEHLNDWEEKYKEINHDTFALRNASIWHIGETEEELVHRSLWLVLFQSDGSFIAIHFLCVVLIAFFYTWKYKMS